MSFWLSTQPPQTTHSRGSNRFAFCVATGIPSSADRARSKRANGPADEIRAIRRGSTYSPCKGTSVESFPSKD